MSARCSHLDSIQVTELPDSIAGCEECLASGGWWLHLRMCQSCGHTGCCDNSPNRHASAHARDTGHPIMRSAEPGEDWSYCYLDDIAFVLNLSPAARWTRPRRERCSPARRPGSCGCYSFDRLPGRGTGAPNESAPLQR